MANKKRYLFEQQTKEQLKGFMAWLRKGGHAQSTSFARAQYAGYFLEWLKGEPLTPEGARYNDLLGFIDHCRQEGDNNGFINRKLLSVRLYYEYLQETDPAIINPATGLQIKGIVKKIPSNLLDIKELEELYNSRKTSTLRDKRNKAILGLFIFQGISTEDLHALKTSHLYLEQGKIQIPGNRRVNRRVLDLKPFQVMELYKYIDLLRPEIIENLTVPQRVPEGLLFFSMQGCPELVSSLLEMFKEIRRTMPGIQNAHQIRASVIANWLKSNNLRQVQYMAGHKYVSSTERYQLGNLEKLQEQLEKYHPLSRI
jgi:integrase/recombinase XerD